MSELANLPPLISTKKYAELTGENEQSIRRRCKAGTIPAIKNGRCWLISSELTMGKLIELEKTCA